MTTITLQEYYDQLSRHDWTFQYSDDHSVWRRGSSEESRLIRIYTDNGPAFKELFDGFKNHVFNGEIYGTVKTPLPKRPEDGQ